VYRVVSEATEDPVETFQRTLDGLVDALGRAAWLSLEGAPRRVMAEDLVIRRFERVLPGLQRIRPGVTKM
jgi:hypothetical protein